MADRIQYIDNDGDHIYPVTHERGVFDDSGISIEPKLQDSVDMEVLLMAKIGYTNEQMQEHTKYNYYILATGLWNTNNTYKHLRYTVSAGQCVSVTANATNPAYVAMLKSGTSSSGGTPDYATGWSNRATIPAGHTMRFTVPDDAKICYVYASSSSSGYAYIPEKFVWHKANGPAMQAKADKLADATEGDIAMFDATGNLADMGRAIADIDTPLLRMRVRGTGNAITYSKAYRTIFPGHTYRLYVKAHDITGLTFGNTNSKLVIYSQDGEGTATALVTVLKPEPFEPYYKFTTPSDCESIYLGIRAVAGFYCEYYLDDMTPLEDRRDDIDSPLLRVTYKGADNTLQYTGAIHTLIPGHKYRLYVVKQDVSGITYTSSGYIYLQVFYKNSEGTSITDDQVYVRVTETLADHYDFIVPEEAVSTIVSGRATEGTMAIYEIEDITGIAMVEDLEDGTVIPHLAENLESWEARDNLTVEDTFGEGVQTTAGDVSIVTDEGAQLVKIVATTDFSATALVATGFNLLHNASSIGTGYYFFVPKLEFGTFGTALKPNGVLFTSSENVNLTPTVRFKALENGLPTSIDDGIACPYTNSNGYRFYTTPGIGYMIVSGITYADTCAHIGWSRRYDEFVSPTDTSDAGSTIPLTTALTALHDWGTMLVIGDLADELEWTNNTTVKWTRRSDRIIPEWTTTQEENGYLHSATINTMAVNGTAILNGEYLTVEDYTVSYTDDNEQASSDYVYFNLASATTGTVTLSNSINIEDWGLVYLGSLSGTAEVTMRYAQGYPDALATLVDAKLGATVGLLEDEIADKDARLRRLEALDLSLYDYTGVRMVTRSTANCYIVRTPGSYKIPLIYGNAIKRGETNSAAYTRLGTTYTTQFVNHLGNQITSPYIEANTNCNASSVGLLWQSHTKCITEVNLLDGTDCRYLQFNVNRIPPYNGHAVVYVKDTNDEIMWSWMIWLTTDNLAPLTFTNATGVDYDLMPEALGAIWISTRQRYAAPYYQWGRKDPMPMPSSTTGPSARTYYDINNNTFTGFGTYGIANDADAGGTDRSLANGIKMPGKFFLQYNSVNYQWHNLTYAFNLWNANETSNTEIADNQDSAIKTIYDPCPAGWMLPGARAFTGCSSSNTIGAWSYGWTFKRNSDDNVGNFFPAIGRRNCLTAALVGTGSYGYYWSYGGQGETTSRVFTFTSSTIATGGSNYRAQGYSVCPTIDKNF